MQKKLSKEIKTYCRAIKKALICPHSLKCAFMADIKSQILDYVEEIGVDSINIQDIKYRFGTPEDIARSFYSDQDMTRLQKAARKYTLLKILTLACLAVLIFVIVLLVIIINDQGTITVTNDFSLFMNGGIYL